MCVPVQVPRPQVDVECLLLLLLRQGISQNLKLPDLTRWPGLKASGFLLSLPPSAGTMVCSVTLGFLHESWRTGHGSLCSIRSTYLPISLASYLLQCSSSTLHHLLFVLVNQGCLGMPARNWLQ